MVLGTELTGYTALVHGSFWYVPCSYVSLDLQISAH